VPHVTEDNKSVANKVFLRRKATEHLTTLRVLDLFAGNNVLWRNFEKERYYGVELLPDKGMNLNADARQVVDSLDLSDFNVIDCDSYTIPFEICKKIIESPLTKSGTTVLYTAVSSIFTQLSSECIDALGIRELYKDVPSLFRLNGIDYFYDMLGNLGVKEIHYYENVDGYTKHYGYFVTP